LKRSGELLTLVFGGGKKLEGEYQSSYFVYANLIKTFSEQALLLWTRQKVPFFPASGTPPRPNLPAHLGIVKC
jgi:hypothetical protein